MPGRALNTPLVQALAKGKRFAPRHCARCLKTCDPAKVPYCITHALIEAVKGNVEEGLFFCGANVGRLDRMYTVRETDGRIDRRMEALPMKLAVLYAGQGAQHPGMGKEFYESSPAFRAAFDSAALDFDLHRVCFEDPDGVLNQTEYTQPCMVAFACGVTAVLAEQDVQPAYAAGLSLGEYSALEAAGVFTAKQAIELAAYRGKAMADAARASTAA